MRTRIGSVKSTQKITKALPMVAAAKQRRAQLAAEAAKPYARGMASAEAIRLHHGGMRPGGGFQHRHVGADHDDNLLEHRLHRRQQVAQHRPARHRVHRLGLGGLQPRAQPRCQNDRRAGHADTPDQPRRRPRRATSCGGTPVPAPVKASRGLRKMP